MDVSKVKCFEEGWGVAAHGEALEVRRGGVGAAWREWGADPEEINTQQGEAVWEGSRTLGFTPAMWRLLEDSKWVRDVITLGSEVITAASRWRQRGGQNPTGALQEASRETPW